MTMKALRWLVLVLPLTAGYPAPGRVNLYGNRTIDVRTYGAKGDGVTDDTAAIQAAINAATAAGGGTVRIPGGTYLLNSHYPSAHPWFFYNLNITSNVALVGDAGAKLLQGPGGRHALVFGATEVRNTVLAVGSNYVIARFQNPSYNGGFYTLNATSVNDAQVTLATAAQAAHFAVGDYVAVYSTTSGDVIPSEMSQVMSVNSSSGVVALSNPLARSFSNPSIANVTALVTVNVRINNLLVQGTEPLAVMETFGFVAEDDQFFSDTSIGSNNTYGLNLNTLTGFTFSGNIIRSVNGPYVGYELPQRNSQNGVFDHNTFYGLSVGFGEYAAHWKLTDNHVWLFPNASTTGGLILGGLDVDFSHNDVHGGNLTAGSGSGALILDGNGPDFYFSYIGGIRIHGNTIDCQADGNSCVKLGAVDTLVFGNDIHVTSGNALGIKVEGPLAQTVRIEDNIITTGTGSGIVLNSHSPDGTVVANNTITGAGPVGIELVSPGSPNDREDIISGNSISGFITAKSMYMTRHPGTVYWTP